MSSKLSSTHSFSLLIKVFCKSTINSSKHNSSTCFKKFSSKLFTLMVPLYVGWLKSNANLCVTQWLVYLIKQGYVFLKVLPRINLRQKTWCILICSFLRNFHLKSFTKNKWKILLVNTKGTMVREVYNHQFLHVIFKRIEVHFCRSFLKNSSIVA